MGKVFTVGDIHGAHKALLQVLERSGFDKENDTLISLGDIADGWDEVYECVEELLTIPNLIAIKGNHDDWFNTWIKTGIHPTANSLDTNKYNEWGQGAEATKKSYKLNLGVDILNPMQLPYNHINFFNKQDLYYVDEENRCFVHGGFNRHHYIATCKQQEPSSLYWDRDLWLAALSHKGLTDRGDYDGKFKMKDNFSNVFIGHTSTIMWKTDQPMNAANIWNIDTGAGFSGRLTIMDVYTKEYWQSDLVQELYPNQRGRN